MTLRTVLLALSIPLAAHAQPEPAPSPPPAPPPAPAPDPAPAPAPMPTPTPAPAGDPAAPAPTPGPDAQPQPPPAYPTYAPPTPYTGEDPDAAAKKGPRRGSFDAGGKVRFPSGPDETGEYATWNWVAFDAIGRYFLLDGITVNGRIPFVVIKPDTALVAGRQRGPGRVGGLEVRLDLMVPKAVMNMLPGAQTKKSEIGLTVTGAYAHDGALLLSERDFPLYTGGFHPGLVLGLVTKVKLGSVVDFNFLPVWTSQYGDDDTKQGVQVPLDLTISLGSLVKVALELGVFTGDDYSLRARNGGRLPLGASLDVKIGKIIAHVGAGWASLITDPAGFYPTVGDSVYFDLNVKFAK